MNLLQYERKHVISVFHIFFHKTLELRTDFSTFREDYKWSNRVQIYKGESFL